MSTLPMRRSSRSFSVQQAGQVSGQARIGLAQGGGVGAVDVEDPEGQKRAVQMGRHAHMAGFDEADEAGEVFRLADFIGAQSAAGEQAAHHDARGGEIDFWGDARFGRRPGRCLLVETHDAVFGNVLAEAHGETLAVRLLDAVIAVGDAAMQRPDRDRAGPERECLDFLDAGIGHGGIIGGSLRERQCVFEDGRRIWLNAVGPLEWCDG